MLGLNVKLDVDVKKVTLPFTFVGKNRCVHCGGENCLEFVDKFGNRSKKEINAFDHIICNKCKRFYSIRWTNEEGSTNMVPSAVNPSITRDLTNLFNIKEIRANGDKTLN
jgi:hypothetical protein